MYSLKVVIFHYEKVFLWMFVNSVLKGWKVYQLDVLFKFILPPVWMISAKEYP